MEEEPLELRLPTRYIRYWLLVLILGCSVFSTEIYEGAETSSITYAVNSSEVFKNIKCDSNSSRFVNINFTFTYTLSNGSLEFNLTAHDGYTIFHQEVTTKRMTEKLFLLGASYVNDAITSVKGNNIVTFTSGVNDSRKIEFNIKEKNVITEREDQDGPNTCTTIVHGNVTGFKLVLDPSISPDEKDLLGLTPLHWAAMFGDVSVIHELLKMGSDINTRWTREMATPLHFAAVRGDRDVVRYLVENGADLDAKDVEDMTVVDAAIYANQSEVVKQLIDLGANLSSESLSGRTPLHMAVERGNLEIIQTLLEKGVDVNAKDQEGWTPLNVAFQYFQGDAVRELVERGANVNYSELVKLHGEGKVDLLLGTNRTIVT